MSFLSALIRKTVFPLLMRRDGTATALRYYEFLNKSQHWSRQEILDYQWQELQKLIKHAHDNTVYWPRVMAERGLTLASFRSPEDLALLPILTREIVAEEQDNLIARPHTRDSLSLFYSGGTTGQLAYMWLDQESYNMKLASSWRFDRWMGMKRCDKVAQVWSAAMDYAEDMPWRGRFKMERIRGEKMLYAGALDEQRLQEIYHDLMAFDPEFIRCFPAALYDLTEYIEINRLPVPKIKAIMSTAEVLHDYKREAFTRVFGAPVYDMYGSREAGNTASQCSPDSDLHIAAEMSIVEATDDLSKPLPEGDEGNLLITDLTNTGMPLLRYQINDYGVLTGDKCSCGRHLPMMTPGVGRVQDYLYGPDGRIFSGNAFMYHLTDGFVVDGKHELIGQVQVIQKAIDWFHVRITNRPEPSEGAKNEIIIMVRRLVRADVKVTVEVVERIPREKSGKLRHAICEIDPPEGSYRAQRE